jgi:hypothetical protein
MPVVQVWQGQKNTLRLYLSDANGAPISVALADASSSSSSSSAVPATAVFAFEVRDRPGATRIRLRKRCVVEDAAKGVVTCELSADDTRRIPGIFCANLIAYDPDGELIYQLTKYWFMVMPTMDASYSQMSHYDSITIPEIRLMLREVCPEQNFLLDDYEFDDSQIVACMRLPIDEFNEKYQPKSNYTMATFPFRFHWLRATTGYLMDIASRGYARDHLPYTAGGVSVDDKNKFGVYANMGQQLLGEWRDFIKNTKLEMNIESGYGRLGSKYRYTYWVP